MNLHTQKGLTRILMTVGWCILVLCFKTAASKTETFDSATQTYLRSGLPDNLTLSEPIPQEYMITSTSSNHDIYGALTGKTCMTAQYTRALKDGAVRWNDVRLAKTSGPDASLSKGTRQDYMEGFQYQPSGEVMNPAFFKGFPPEKVEAKVLVWDMLSIETWAWQHFHDLSLNKALRPNSGSEDYQMADVGSMQNKDLKLTWVGISERHKEQCALIQFESLFNVVNINMGPMKIKGRTHYWGSIWVSLKDKQIEHAVLYEDGILEINQDSQSEKPVVNVLREVTFTKVVNN